MEVLKLRDPHTIVEQIIAPPPVFSTPVVLLSNLCVLSLAPSGEGMAYLQPILDAACNTLEELYVISSSKCGVFDNKKGNLINFLYQPNNFHLLDS